MEKNEAIAKTKDMGELKLTDLKFAPNPNNGQFKLSFGAENESLTQVRIVDVTGQVVFETELKSDAKQYNQDIDISNNPKGLYILQIMQDGNVMTKKMLVQ